MSAKDRFSEMLRLREKRNPEAQAKFNEWYNSLTESEKEDFAKYDKKWTRITIAVFGLIFVALVSSCFGSDDKKKEEPKPQVAQTQQVKETKQEKVETEAEKLEKEQLNKIREHTKVKDLMNGANTKAIGKYSVTEMTSSEFDSLKEVWYFKWAKDKVDKHEWNYAVVVFTDKQGYGASYNGVVQINCQLTKDRKDGSYSIGNGDIYVESDSDKGHLKKFE